MTPRNTEYTKYDPPGAQISDDALAQKYLLYTPPARLKLRYRELDDENTTTYGRISSMTLFLVLNYERVRYPSGLLKPRQ